MTAPHETVAGGEFAWKHPPFDHDAIRAHMQMLHGLASMANVDGKLILAIFADDPATGHKITEAVLSFKIGDVDGMTGMVLAYEKHEHANIYAPFAIMRPDLPLGKKGGEADVRSVLALVGDLDADTGKVGTLPLPAPYVIETSPGNTQAFYPLSTTLPVNAAKPIAQALCAAIGCDYGTKDLSKVWRIPGTLNWPVKTKLERGRSPEPQPVTVVTPWAGEMVEPERLKEAVASHAKPNGKANGHDHAGGGAAGDDWRLLWLTLPEATKKLIIAPALPGEDRSAVAFSVILTLINKGWNDEKITAVIEAHPQGIGARYAERKDLEADIRRAHEKRKQPGGDSQSSQWQSGPVGLAIINAGTDDWNVSPREWLLGNVFCREYVSSILGDGGVGKTSLRYAQYLSLAIGRSLTGEYVFQRCRVLIISLEDSTDELRRRMKAACLHHGVSQDELNGWMFYVALSASDGKLMVLDAKGKPVVGQLAADIEKTVIDNRTDLVALDPFVKTHSVEENSNSAIDDVVQILSNLASKHKIAVDAPHHISKGNAEPGNANRGRGASAAKDAFRLVYTLFPMTREEAEVLGVSEAERRSLIRMDSGKVNIAPPMHKAKWFRLVGVPLGNSTKIYPKGDNVQTVEAWKPPDAFADTSTAILNSILDDIAAGMDDGQRYSSHHNAKTRAAWCVIRKHVPTKSEAQAREVIKVWIKSGLLIEDSYHDEERGEGVKGLRVDDSKRPGTAL